MKFVFLFLMFLVVTTSLTIAEETAPGMIMPSYATSAPAEAPTPPEVTPRKVLQPSYYENGRPVYVNPKEKHIDCSDAKNVNLKECKYN